MKYKRLSLLLFLSLLVSCGYDRSERSRHEDDSAKPTSGILEIGILAEGME